MTIFIKTPMIQSTLLRARRGIVKHFVLALLALASAFSVPAPLCGQVCTGFPSSGCDATASGATCSLSGCVCPLFNMDPCAPDQLVPTFYYAPPEVKNLGDIDPCEDEFHWLTVFRPTGAPPPGGWPVILMTDVGAYLEPSQNCDRSKFGPRAGLCDSSWPLSDFGSTYYDLVTGANAGMKWAVISVGTVGVLSDLSGGNTTYPPNVDFGYDPTVGSLWEDYSVWWGEKDFTWARQWVAENSSDLCLDNNRVVVAGQSAGADYAAFVALGPSRIFRTGTSSQSAQDTRCAGFIGLEPPSWLSLYVDGASGIHWPNENDPESVALSLDDVAAESLKMDSPSRSVRVPGSASTCTPAILFYDEDVAVFDFGRINPGNGIPDYEPSANGILDSIPIGMDPIHATWFGIVLREDLAWVNSVFHERHSRLHISSDEIADAGDLQFAQAQLLDLPFLGLLGEQTWAPLLEAWLDKYNPANGWPFALACPRLGGQVNTPLLTSLSEPILGTSWNYSIQAPDLLQTSAVVYFSLSALAAPVASIAGEVLVDLSPSMIIDTANLPFVAGVATGSSPVPNDMNLVGMELYVQAFAAGRPGGTGPEALNALDLLLSDH